MSFLALTSLHIQSQDVYRGLDGQSEIIKIEIIEIIYDRELSIARLVPQFVNRDSAETLHYMDLFE